MRYFPSFIRPAGARWLRRFTRLLVLAGPALVLAGLALVPGIHGAMAAAAPPAAPGWGALDFLIGRWATPTDGPPGAGSGAFDLTPQLEGHVLLRHSRADYPATADKPAEHHQDLMVISPGPAGPATAPWHADYWDGEGHVIRYTVTASAAGDSIRFLSDPTPGAPTFRLTYTRKGPDDVDIAFDIALPGQPGFQTYKGGSAHRMK